MKLACLVLLGLSLNLPTVDIETSQSPLLPKSITYNQLINQPLHIIHIYMKWGCYCNKYLKMWKMLQNWEMGKGWKSFEVHVRNMDIKDNYGKSQMEMRTILFKNGGKVIFVKKWQRIYVLVFYGR